MANHRMVRVMPFYLVKVGGKSAAHLWDGRDTLCCMYSTHEDWKKHKWALIDADELGPRSICKVCMALAAKHQKKDW